MSDPAAVETIVVKVDEIITAVEANERGREAVLRVTAPFSARMRARLHVTQPGDADDPAQLLIPPRTLLEDDCPPLPPSDDSAERLREDSDEQYSIERHRDIHETALEEWRTSVPEHVVDRLAMAGIDDPVTVSVLGDSDE